MKKFLCLAMGLMVATLLFGEKKTVQFNVMVSDNAGAKKVTKVIKKQEGVSSVKTTKMGISTVVYNDEKTNIGAILNAFRAAGFFASPIGENCANKPGGCLNNAPTQTNTMR